MVKVLPSKNSSAIEYFRFGFSELTNYGSSNDVSWVVVVDRVIVVSVGVSRTDTRYRVEVEPKLYRLGLNKLS
jgi:hypothetical protein